MQDQYIMRRDKIDDLEFIKNFSKVSVSKACKKAKVDISNLYAGRVKKEKVKLIKRILESDLAKLYIIEEKGE